MTTLNKTWTIPPEARTHCAAGLHEWTTEHIRVDGRGYQYCYTCKKLTYPAQYAKRKADTPRIVHSEPVEPLQIPEQRGEEEQSRQEEIAAAMQAAYVASLRRCHTCHQLRPPASFVCRDTERVLIVCHVCRYEVNAKYLPDVERKRGMSRGHVICERHNSISCQRDGCRK